jgi:hypothetical protein
MLAVKIYILICLFAAAAAALLYFTGRLSLIAFILFGELVLGLAFVGIIGVLLSGVIYQCARNDR